MCLFGVVRVVLNSSRTCVFCRFFRWCNLIISSAKVRFERLEPVRDYRKVVLLQKLPFNILDYPKRESGAIVAKFSIAMC